MMKYIAYMICAASLLGLLLLATSCSKSVPPTPQEPQENTFKAKFMATPNSFSGYGGYGKVHGVLQELSPSGELLHETPLGNSEFTLHFEKYSSEIEPCAYRPNEFFVREGINAKTFKIEAEVISGKGKGCKQTILIMRGGWRFSFKAEPSQFTSKGGSGKVIGTMYITDFDGNVVKESDLGDCNFGLNVVGNPKGITIDDLEKTFTVAAGGPTTFELQACTGYGQPYLIEIKREG
ncbi:hypothetical protein [Porphyromonas asaccharolytica]|nr:hypothetical protein [Porphyromonas asaccharolytica]